MKIIKAISITVIIAACLPLALQAQRQGQGQGQGRSQDCSYQQCSKNERQHKNCRASYNNGLHDNCPLSCPHTQQSKSKRSR